MVKVIGFVFFLLSIAGNIGLMAQGNIYTGNKGKVYFRSDAPLEVIEAESNVMRGAINVQKRSFAFKVKINTFEGFNSALQRVHFNENYLESNSYPLATFNGRIIEDVDLSKDGEYLIRSKGKLTIHGIAVERIIKSKVLVKDGKMDISSSFTALLEEHDIKIPKIVYQKIAEEIYVIINIQLLAGVNE